MTSSLDTVQHLVKGIHYLDLIAFLSNQGASISDITYENNDSKKHISFFASYCNGMTVLEENLYYQDNILLKWTVTSSDGLKRIIFSRDKLQ